jgi:hypothetical protein
LLVARGIRIASLLGEADRLIPGRLDAASGRIDFAEPSRPDVDDLLDETTVLTRGGEVIMISGNRMPTTSGAAAIFRF